MKRRDFLRTLGLSAALSPMMAGGIPLRALAGSPLLRAMPEETDRILILISLNGGNDGLNTIIPLAQYSNLSRARNNILIPENKVLRLTDQTGVHPAWEGIQQLYSEEKIAIVQSAGYPSPNFSHFRSTDIWTSASASDQVWDTGWLGRHLGQNHPSYPEDYPNTQFPDPLAITMGSLISNTCQGPVMNFSIAIRDPESFTQLLSGGTGDVPPGSYGEELAFIRQSMQQTNLYADAIQLAAGKGNNLSALYPEPGQNELADQLKIVAQLISGGLQTRIYVANLGGFDTHSRQVDNGSVTEGEHAFLLSQVSEAISAFQDDIQRLGHAERVAGMTFSEFGRRIVSNGSRGTDHGAAAPMIVFGSQVNPLIFGDNPLIPDKVNVKDSLPMQFDFRSVYGSVLMDWFEVDETRVKEFIFEDFQYIPVLNRGYPSIYDRAQPLLYQNFPNPFEDFTTFRFGSLGGDLNVSVFDARGQRLQVIAQGIHAPGIYEVEMNTAGWPMGNYYLHYRQGDRQDHIKMFCGGR